MDKSDSTMSEDKLFLADPRHWRRVEGISEYIPIRWRGYFLLFSLVAVLLWVAPFYVPHYENLQRLYAEGKQFNATIVEKATYTSGKKNEVTHCYIVFSYAINNLPYKGSQDLLCGEYDQVKTGDAIAVLYLPEDPSIVRLTGKYQDDGQIIRQFDLLMVVSVLWILSLFGAFIHFVFTIQLMRKGELLTGRITESDVRKNKNGDSLLDIKYQFISPKTERPIKGGITIEFKKWDGGAVSKGSPIKVLYLSDFNYRLM